MTQPQTGEDQTDWYRYTGRPLGTTSLSAASQGDWYIYREGDDPRQQGDTAMYVYMMLHVDKCFTFYVRDMYRTYITTLTALLPFVKYLVKIWYHNFKWNFEYILLWAWRVSHSRVNILFLKDYPHHLLECQQPCQSVSGLTTSWPALGLAVWQCMAVQWKGRTGCLIKMVSKETTGVQHRKRFTNSVTVPRYTPTS